MSAKKHVTQQEMEFIKVHALDMTISEIATALGRNYWTIQRCLDKLGVPVAHRFTPKDDYIIKTMYKTHRASIIATKIGVDETAIYNRAKKLGLRKNASSR